MAFKPLPIGIENFKEIIDKNFYYIDKTLVIKELIDSNSKVTLFTRPRRFGKTLNMSMLQYFFEKRIDRNGNIEDNTYLFENTKIMNAGELYSKHMGQYPVINLSLKSAKQPSSELAYECIKSDIAREFERHKYVIESNNISSKDKDFFKRICEREDDEKLYVTSLKFLCECLEKYHRKKVIILIDEYDVPLENSYFEGFYNNMIKFIRSLFESALKTNNSLEFAVLTGCLIIKETPTPNVVGVSDSHKRQAFGSLLTGLNNLDIISILNNYYSEYFGFTENEVEKMLDFYEVSSKFPTVKTWYNGYLFGDTEVYNPWSTVKIVKDLYKDIDVIPTSYWANTSSNSIVRSLIDRADLTTKEEIENLIMGKTIEKPVHEDITYDEIYKSTDNLWNFMFFTGYLKKVSQRYTEKENLLELKIPNEEVEYIFRNKILDWFNEQIKTRDLFAMYEAMFSGDILTFENELVSVLEESISFNDSYENFYHGFFLGTLMNIKNYKVKSNREVGNGRSDIIVKYPNRRGKAVIIELKVAKSTKELAAKCSEGLKQIEKNRYDMELVNEGYEDILKYGIAFYKKDCMIKKL